LRKIYVDMTAVFDEMGNIMPVMFRFEDGNTYHIDKIIDVKKRAAMKTGGVGLRYTCRIKNALKYIYLEENRWFIETDK